MSLWSSIRERRITQVALGYLAGGWMVLAVFDQFADRGVLPDVVYRVALTLYLFGIPAALILGWHHGEKGRQAATAGEIAQLAVLALLAVGTSTWVIRSELAERARLGALSDVVDLRSVAVLYFEPATEDLRLVADGFTEGLIASLAGVRDLDVMSANAVVPFRAEPVPPDSAGRLLGTGVVIAGTVAREGGALRVTVRVVDSQSGAPLATVARDWPADDVLAVRNELPGEVARQFRERLGQEIKLRETRRGASSTPAWLLVQRAGKLGKDADGALAHGDLGAALDAYRQADQELGRASELDPEWPAPLAQRGWIAYERSWLAGRPEEARTSLEQAAGWADSALAVEPLDEDALELRGTAHYRLWTLQLATAPADADTLLAIAQADLEEATRLDESRASAYSTLSHLYYQTGDLPGAVLAARKAYTEDAYLRAADGVLWRLYSASYDLEDAATARTWCQEGRGRFPSDFRFVECQIWLLTMGGSDPDVAAAWGLLGEMEPLVPEPARPFYLPGARMAVAGVIGRAGLPDSARAVMLDARAEGAGTDAEGELTSIEAAMRLLIGDRDEALDLLERYVVGHPGHFGQGRRLHWWWRSLEGDPRFETLRSLS